MGTEERLKDRGLFKALYLLFFLYGLVLYLPLLKKPLDHDESQWIYVSQHYIPLLFRRDFKSPVWEEYFLTFGTPNPKIGTYIIGLPLYFAKELKPNPDTMKWDWNQKPPWNQARGYGASERAIFYGRLLMPFLSAGLLSGFFFFSRRVFGTIPGFLGTVFLSHHQVLKTQAYVARIDIPAWFFATLVLMAMAGINWQRLFKGAVWKSLFASGLIGLLLGLAWGTKLNTLPLVGVWILYLGLQTCLEIKPKLRLNRFGLWRFLYLSALSILVAGFIFVISNPYLYTSSLGVFLERAKNLFSFGAYVRTIMERVPELALSDNLRKMVVLHILLFDSFLTFPKLFHPTAVLLYLLCLIGIYSIIHKIRVGFYLCKEDEEKGWNEFSSGALSAIVVVLISVPNYLWVPMPWIRWFLPFVLPQAILVCASLDGLGKMFKEMRENRKPAQSDKKKQE